MLTAISTRVARIVLRFMGSITGSPGALLTHLLHQFLMASFCSLLLIPAMPLRFELSRASLPISLELLLQPTMLLLPCLFLVPAVILSLLPKHVLCIGGVWVRVFWDS